MLPERPSEQAMREVSIDRARNRATTPSGGPDHPFVDGSITLRLDWTGYKRLRTSRYGKALPHHLTPHEMAQIWEHADTIRRIVYTAAWRAAQAEEPPANP